MADELDHLLDKVEDPAVRHELRAGIARLRSRRSFGLVFEDHIPERVRLPEHPIRRGLRTVRRDDVDGAQFHVAGVADGLATVAAADGEALTMPTGDLVVVAEFGDPIHPGLERLGSIDRGGDKPAHVVINAENHHALELLRFTHAGKVDCIYIDPPYNTGARDWKYDNNYVDADDAYRHSKWLASMQRRLRLAKELLDSADSVLIVAIDEKEVHRLGLLLEQVFPGCTSQMVSVVIKPEGTGRFNEFSRTNEFLYFVWIGAAQLAPTSDDMTGNVSTADQPVEWRNLRRRERESVRGSRPRQFYPVFVDDETKAISSVGDPLTDDVDRNSVDCPPGTSAVWPLTPSGTEMIWSLVPGSLRRLVEAGYARASQSGVQFLNAGTVASIERGEIEVVGRDSRGVAEVRHLHARPIAPKTAWSREAHNSQAHGTLLVSKLLPGRHFPFPKSLYAVEDAIRFFVAGKPDAVVLDFFGGSGTTTHAVARLNRQDGGRRQSILVTNNEVSAEEARSLTHRGLRDGDPEWEAAGIFEHIARPRVTAAITGRTPDGSAVRGDYRFVDAFPMAEGFDENVEFLRLTYQDPLAVELNAAFEAIAPVLWMRAGGQGDVIGSRCDDEDVPVPFASTDRYAVLFDPDEWRACVDTLPATVRTVFVVTDSPSTFTGVVAVLPGDVDALQLYENYLQTFAINQTR